MSYKQMTGNIISATKVEPDGVFENSAASGVWSLQEQYDYRRGGNWPETGNAILGGGGGGNNDVIEFVTIATTGNATDFGDLSEDAEDLAGCSSNVRALMGTNINGKIQYITIASTGNATLFGETQYENRLSNPMATSSNIRAIFCGGQRSSSYKNDMEYFTIASTGNGTDFGDLTVARNRGAGTSTAHGGIAT